MWSAVRARLSPGVMSWSRSKTHPPTTAFGPGPVRWACTKRVTDDDKNNKTGQEDSDTASTTTNPSDKQRTFTEEDRLYTAVLDEVKRQGWTSVTLDTVISQHGLSPAATAMFPDGIATIASRLDAQLNRELAQHLMTLKNATSDKHIIKASPPERAAYAMTKRLQLADDFHQFWYQAISHRPRVPRDALYNRSLLADEIAAFASYNRPDMSWYSDRVVLATVYQLAELYWITDSSPSRVATTHFIHARLHAAHGLRSALASSLATAANVATATSATLTTLLRATRSY